MTNFEREIIELLKYVEHSEPISAPCPWCGASSRVFCDNCGALTPTRPERIHARIAKVWADSILAASKEKTAPALRALTVIEQNIGK